MRQTLKEISTRILDISSTVLFAYLIPHAKKSVALVTLILLLVIISLGWMSAKMVRETVIADFNQQQLILSRHAAGNTQVVFEVFLRELFLLSLDPSLQHPEAQLIEQQMRQSYFRLTGQGLISMRYVESTGRVHSISTSGTGALPPDEFDPHMISWAQTTKNKGTLYLVSTDKPEDEKDYHLALRIHMAMPVWHADPKTNSAVGEDTYDGVIICTADATVIAKNALKDIRSGKTGYGWMIDNHGTFLYHPETQFIGRNAFEARAEREPAISFARINEIQRDRMLKGEEGTSWFDSGWHRGITGKMKKLIAFSPITISGGQGKLIWSVAVVAPMSEVQGAIGEIQMRQYLLEAIITLIVIVGSIIIFTLLIRWSSSLRKEVRKKTDELHQSERLYASLVEHANDIIFTVDRNDDFLTINKAGVDFFNMSKEKIIGNNIGTLCFNEENASRQFKAIDEVFETGESRQLVYAVHIKGVEYWLNTNFSPLLDADNKPYAALVISRDVTERKKTEERMYHTEKLASLGTLAAGVAHEINNPLAIILGFTDMLLGTTPPGSEPYDILKTIEKQGNNAKRVVENLLSFARYRESKEELIDINSNIEEVLAVAGNTLRVSKVVVDKRLANEIPMVNGDSREIQQVFLNIINNAVYAMKGKGVLTIETGLAANGRGVEIRFSDTGQGIKKEHRTRIFDPLFTTKEVGEGTGLGLSVCYAIVAKFGGTITFDTRTEEDEARPTGTTFIITLPTEKEL